MMSRSLLSVLHNRWLLMDTGRKCATGLEACAFPAPLGLKHHMMRNYPQMRSFSGGSLKIISDRIKSVKSIQKITKTMKTIAASKLKGDQNRLINGYPFSIATTKLIKHLPVSSSDKGDLLVLPITSDKGLCGGVNSAIARQARNAIVEAEATGSKVTIFGVGDKIRSALTRLFGNRFGRIINEAAKLPWNFSIACLIAERIIHENPDRLLIVYNHFKSAISYETMSLYALSAKQAMNMDKHELHFMEFEPDLTSMWNDFHEFHYATLLHGCMLDSIAAEQSARLNAMDNASSNAGDMLSKLTLKYNRARQAKITSELIEIISGANAL